MLVFDSLSRDLRTALELALLFPSSAAACKHIAPSASGFPSSRGCGSLSAARNYGFCSWWVRSNSLSTLHKSVLLHAGSAEQRTNKADANIDPAAYPMHSRSTDCLDPDDKQLLFALQTYVHHCCKAATSGRCNRNDVTCKETDGACNWCSIDPDAYSFSPGILVLLQLALVHLHVPQALAAPTR